MAIVNIRVQQKVTYLKYQSYFKKKCNTTDTCDHTGQTWNCASSVTLWFDFINTVSPQIMVTDDIFTTVRLWHNNLE